MEVLNIQDNKKNSSLIRVVSKALKLLSACVFFLIPDRGSEQLQMITLLQSTKPHCGVSSC